MSHAPGPMNSTMPSAHDGLKTSKTVSKNKSFLNDLFDVRDRNMEICRVPGVGAGRGPDPW